MKTAINIKQHILLSILMIGLFHTSYAQCDWNLRVEYFFLYDSCKPSNANSKIHATVQIFGGHIDSVNGGSFTVNNIPQKDSFFWDFGTIKSEVSFYPTTNGMHTFCLVLKNLTTNCDTSICRTINYKCGVLSTNDISSLKTIAYPNPTADFVNLTGSLLNVDVTLFNAVGKQVPLKVTDNKIDLSHMATGFYFIRLNKDDMTETIRILKI